MNASKDKVTRLDDVLDLLKTTYSSKVLHVEEMDSTTDRLHKVVTAAQLHNYNLAAETLKPLAQRADVIQLIQESWHRGFNVGLSFNASVPAPPRSWFSRLYLQFNFRRKK